MNLAQRKTLELQRKMAALTRELESWKHQSEEGQPLEKHHTQIRRLDAMLSAAGESLKQALEQAIVQNRVLAQWQQLERGMLELHRIWSFFQTKLAQRGSSWYRDGLDAADELAWACYHPMMTGAPLKEPPLVFFNGCSSPFIGIRNSYFEPERVAGEQLSTPQFIKLLKSLPIPVIGLPWFQIQHMPDMLVIAHEVGHAVEFDFRLSEPLCQSLRDAHLQASTADQWIQWKTEVFADLYGVLCLGPAFVSALADFLVSDKQSLAGEDAHNRYPTAYLRLLLCLEALDLMGFRPEDAGLENWQQEWGANHRLSSFEADIPKVVRALIDHPLQPLNNKSVRSIICFDSQDQNQTTLHINMLAGNYALQTRSVRVMFAALGLLFRRDPEQFNATAGREDQMPPIPKRALAYLKTIRESGVRADDDEPVDLQDQLAADRQQGLNLMEQFLQDSGTA